MKNKKPVWFTYFSNVVPAEYEKWMEDMEAQGWHIRKIGQWSSLRMVFYKERPRKYRYVFDLQPFPKKDYKDTYRQFGWEFVGQMASAFIWRREYEGERPEAFTDSESLEKRSTRTAGAASVSMTMFWTAAAAIAILLVTQYGNMSASTSLQLIIADIFFGVLAILMTLAVWKIYKNRNK